MKVIPAFLLLLVAVGFVYAQNEQSPIVEKNFAYKDWTYKAIKGDGKTNLRDFTKGKKLILVVYWAPWCPNWEHDIAFVKSLHEKYKDKGLAIIGVGEYDTVNKLRAHIDKNNLSFPLVYESDSTGAREKTTHYAQRREAGDTRKWGSPWYIFLDPATLESSGEVLTKKTTVVNGELIQPDAEKYIREKLGLVVAGSIAAKSGEIEACDPGKKTTALVKP
jgi:peroxiredoxin